MLLIVPFVFMQTLTSSFGVAEGLTFMAIVGAVVGCYTR